MLIRSLAAIAAARLVVASLAVVALYTSAQAANITFVAANGNDANPCTVIAAPCKTLQRAYTVTPTNGTISVLTSLDNATLAINKNIAVVGNGVAIVGSIAIGTSSTNAIVTLRGLALNGAKIYTNGIRIDAAAAVYIENCTTERYTATGIRLFATTATELFVSDTVSHDNGSGLYVSDADARVTIYNSRFENNTSAGLQLLAANSNVTRSIASRNTYGILIYGGTTNLTETTATDNAVGFNIVSLGRATLSSSVARGNSTYGLQVEANSVVIISGSVFTHNATGIYNAGALYTLENNVLLDNSGSNYVDAGGGDQRPATPF